MPKVPKSDAPLGAVEEAIIGGSEMKRQIISVVFALSILAALAGAQDTPKKDAPPKPAVGPSQALLESWNDVGRKLIAMAEDFPEDKYDFKPVPAQRSFAEQLLHAAGSNDLFTAVAKGEKPVDAR